MNNHIKQSARMFNFIYYIYYICSTHQVFFSSSIDIGTRPFCTLTRQLPILSPTVFRLSYLCVLPIARFFGYFFSLPQLTICHFPYGFLYKTTTLAYFSAALRGTFGISLLFLNPLVTQSKTIYSSSGYLIVTHFTPMILNHFH